MQCGCDRAGLLLYDVKNHLDITWVDEATDNKIRGLITSGVYYLDSKLGRGGDYETPGFARTLLMEYVRYARDSALDVFESNYQNMILAMQNEEAVKRYAEKAVSSDG